MAFDRLEFIHELSRLLRERKYQKALGFCAKMLPACPDETVLIEYVRLLLQLSCFEKAWETLLDRTSSPFQSLNVFHLYEDYYSLTGNLDDLTRIQENLATGNTGLAAAWSKQAGPEHLDREQLARQFMQELKFWSAQDTHHAQCLKKSYNLMRQGLVEECRQTLGGLTKTEPSSQLGRYLEAELALLSGDLGRAETLFEAMETDYPNPAVIQDRLGDISLRRADYRKAARHYQYSLNFEPQSPQTWIDLIDCYRMLGADDNIRKALALITKNNLLSPETVASLREGPDDSREACPVSVVNGLVYYEGGGGILPIEVLPTDGGDCLVTGNLGMMLFDSVIVAYHCARNLMATKVAGPLGVHVNLPQCVSYKDGPSAGLAFATGILGSLTGRCLPRKTAFTGEIDLSGRVHSVGGIHNKLMAAWYNNINEIWLPAGNHHDTLSLPREAVSRMKLHFTKNIREVLKALWN